MNRISLYLFHDGPGFRGVRCVKDLPHQHGFEEGPSDGSAGCVDHIQIHVHTEGSCTRRQLLDIPVLSSQSQRLRFVGTKVDHRSRRKMKIKCKKTPF